MRCLSAWFDASSSFFERPIRRYASERWGSAMGFDDGWMDGWMYEKGEDCAMGSMEIWSVRGCHLLC